MFNGHQFMSSMRLPELISGLMKFSQANSHRACEPSAEREFLPSTSESLRPPSLQARPWLACCRRSGWNSSRHRLKVSVKLQAITPFFRLLGEGTDEKFSHTPHHNHISLADLPVWFFCRLIGNLHFPFPEKRLRFFPCQIADRRHHRVRTGRRNRIRAGEKPPAAVKIRGRHKQA